MIFVDYDQCSYSVECVECKTVYKRSKAHIARGDGCACLIDHRSVLNSIQKTLYINYKIGNAVKDIDNALKLETECLNCNKKRLIGYNSLSIPCKCYNIKTSKAETFFNALLTSSNIEYKSEVIFDWSDKKRYDFYLPEYETIIEVHGLQHYSNNRFFNMSLEDIKKTDKYKKDMALKNGIKHYYEINASDINQSKLIEEINKANIIPEIKSKFNYDFTEYIDELHKNIANNNNKDLMEFNKTLEQNNKLVLGSIDIKEIDIQKFKF